MKYFKEWEESVMSLIDVDDKEKKKMLLSKETRMGIEMTGMLSRIPQTLHANFFFFFFFFFFFLLIILYA